ncbi:MAG: hypothetical protein RLZZ15_2313 [Verrucomicrobiota bacterium]|jgi:dipeptidyl aminopeptidase/acylaminoacyl peptidase
MFRRAFLLALALAPLLRAQVDTPYRTPSPALAALVDAPLTPFVVLSPDRSRLLRLERAELPTIAELAQPELRLAGLRIDPVTNNASRAATYTGLVLQPIAGGAEQRITGLPAGARIAHYQWSRSGKHLAFTLLRATGLELWLAEVATGKARALTGPVLNGVYNDPVAWLDEATLVIRRIPATRRLPPAESPVPTGPVVQENLGRRAGSRTYEDMLANPHDEALFEYYATSELALVSLGGSAEKFGEPAIYTGLSPSPDGQFLLVESLRRPFSYLVPSSRFPARIAVYRGKNLDHVVADLPLNEGTNTIRQGPRNVVWRADAPATLSWMLSLDRGNATEDEKRPARDAWLLHAAPFQEKPVEMQRFESRAGAVTWGDDALALITETNQRARTTRLWRVSPGEPGAARELLAERATQDRFKDRGRAVLGRNAFGRLVIQRSADGGKIFFTGAGATPQGERPFLDEYELATKQSRRLLQSTPPAYEEFIAFADAALTRVLVRRESATEPDNYFLRALAAAPDAANALVALTRFPNPYPQFAAVKSEVLRYKRADGVALTGTLYLPPDWTPARGPLPTLLWAYPREFQSADLAEQVTPTPEKFTRVSVSGPLPFLLAGYAVLNDPTMPIIAKAGGKSNDTYVEQLVANAQAAVDELVRRGVTDPKRVAVGGHSYGAFMTANLLAHSRIFRAGIARSGAYNRTLTPFGFQSEERTLWQAPALYAAMSPFNFADKVKDPLLLIHGAADNNSGTFPIQSERFYAALKGHGATTRFVVLPHESHGYRAKESLRHMLWEMETWLDTHVKTPPPAKPPAAKPAAPKAAEKKSATPAKE